MKKSFKITHFNCCFLAFMTLLQFSSLSQTKPKEVDTQSQSWFSINSTIRLNDKFGIIADAHIRRTDFIADPSFYFVRTGLSYWIKENITGVLGYGYMWVAPSRPLWHHFAREHRI